ncbi:tRNA (guanine(26)-N(2))-dimethyltransferase-like isoform X3 [Limulus polyphemus]|uniref:tRNA (guanine(26)-N(2))-dimethyltransferase n=1 Tax=Limulus polyphemus TaxID=6850 RepID=A0ABM1S7A9_LIMPO|nr:tRNA (guanine(26)-N(2))-dimethyltransferase-like isoform X3 [Limulus polyphemus]
MINIRGAIFSINIIKKCYSSPSVQSFLPHFTLQNSYAISFLKLRCYSRKSEEMSESHDSQSPHHSVHVDSHSFHFQSSFPSSCDSDSCVTANVDGLNKNAPSTLNNSTMDNNRNYCTSTSSIESNVSSNLTPVVMDEVPYRTITEGKAEVLFPTTHDVFYNPVQEFNRDMSVAVIKTYVKACSQSTGTKCGIVENQSEQELDSVHTAANKKVFQGEIRVLEALAASGLRSVRYAMEVPNLTQIIANDVSHQAVESMKRNIKHNKLEGIIIPSKEEAALLMYQHRSFSRRFHVVDLDPYGSPCQFLDAAVQAVHDGGLLLVTCTDMAVLCGNSSETCRAKYGAVSLKMKSSHEMFQVFSWGWTTSREVVSAMSTQTSGGPIWAANLHDKHFLSSMLQQIGNEEHSYGTAKRMIGILNVILEELEDCPLYYSLDRLCAVVHCITPSLLQFRSAILNAGYKVSLSHTNRTSIKTDAPASILWDIIREWTKQHPVKRKLEEGSPAKVILSKEPSIKVSFKVRHDANPISRQQSLLRFQVNPEPHWGPKARAKASLCLNEQIEKQWRKQGKKIKMKDDHLKEYPCKKIKMGECTFGDQCKYSHELEEKEHQTKCEIKENDSSPCTTSVKEPC